MDAFAWLTNQRSLKTGWWFERGRDVNINKAICRKTVSRSVSCCADQEHAGANILRMEIWNDKHKSPQKVIFLAPTRSFTYDHYLTSILISSSSQLATLDIQGLLFWIFKVLSCQNILPWSQTGCQLVSGLRSVCIFNSNRDLMNQGGLLLAGY